MNALATTAYLETDLEINVAFYETLGFLVVKHELAPVVPNRFMSRPPSYSTTAQSDAAPTSETLRNRSAH
jgi:catechol 2,3-dioxygenase-like lactoylglutathione lyase family enzyme